MFWACAEMYEMSHTPLSCIVIICVFFVFSNATKSVCCFYDDKNGFCESDIHKDKILLSTLYLVYI